MSAKVRAAPGQQRAREKSTTVRAQWKRFKKAARDGSEEAIESLLKLMKTAEKDADRIRAAGIVMAYGWGSPSAEPEPVAAVVNMNTATTEERLRALRAAVAVEEAKLNQKEVA